MIDGRATGHTCGTTVAGGAATLTLDSPHNRNAISTRMVHRAAAGLRCGGR